jgi:two-component system sensor histidine kinase RegB
MTDSPSADAASPTPVTAASGNARVTDESAAEPAMISVSDPPALLAGLRQLMQLRSIAIVGQAAAIALALALDVALPVAPMLVIVGALVAVNVSTSARLKRRTPATHREMTAHLALDLAAFTGLLLLAGGTANPFELLYLLHVVLIAMLLPWRLALVGTVLVLACFALAFDFADPLHYANGEPLPGSLLTLGLWVSFALTAATTAWFLVRIAATLREHDRLLHEAARRVLNDEAVLRMGTLAAGAAHELGTPLTTMSVVVGEMRREADTPARERDVAILAAQIDLCRQALGNLRAAAGHASAEGGSRERLDRFLDSVIARFEAMRPGVPVACRREGSVPAPEIFADASLGQAILILLNNAADASPHHVDVDVRWDSAALRIAVGDRGRGVPPGRLEHLGRMFFTTKAPGRGTGLGLVLAASTVNRLGGTVGWTNRVGGGLCAEIRLPLDNLMFATPHR